MEGCEKLGRPANSAEPYKSQLEAAGFVDVVETKYIWPSNRWPKDRKLKELGMFYILAMDTLLIVNRNVAVGERNFRPRGL